MITITIIMSVQKPVMHAVHTNTVLKGGIIKSILHSITNKQQVNKHQVNKHLHLLHNVSTFPSLYAPKYGAG